MMNMNLYSMFILMNVLFLMLSNPMSINIIILTQTLICCLIMNIMMNNSWYSFIMLIMFLSGMMILFMYMCSISSNLKFKLNKQLIIMIFLMMYMLLMMTINKNLSILDKMSLNMDNYLMMNKSSLLLMKMYNNKSMYLTTLMIIMLFMMLIFVSYMISDMNMPMRKKY
nr:NADH dehydrogenase subunit 6 [Paduniella sp. LP-2022]